MATPLSASAFVAALKAEGVRVAEHSGWRTRNRNHKGAWGPVNGITIHHTAGSNSLGLCVNGTAALPGPLCHTHLAKNALATMVGYGRTNHGGTFARNAHDAVVKESAVHPRPDVAEPVDANARYYGIEIENLGNGKDPYPVAQYDAAVRWAAAICRAHGWSAQSVIGHKEGTRRKIDPSFAMNVFRDAVAARLAHPAGWNPQEDDDMYTPAQIAQAVLHLDGEILIPGAPASNPTWTLASSQTEILKRIDRLNALLSAQKSTIDELVKAVATMAASSGAIDPAAIVTELREAIEAMEFRFDVV